MRVLAPARVQGNAQSLMHGYRRFAVVHARVQVQHGYWYGYQCRFQQGYGHGYRQGVGTHKSTLTGMGSDTGADMGTHTGSLALIIAI